MAPSRLRGGIRPGAVLRDRRQSTAQRLGQRPLVGQVLRVRLLDRQDVGGERFPLPLRPIHALTQCRDLSILGRKLFLIVAGEQLAQRLQVGHILGADALDGSLDLLPLLARLADSIEPEEGAALFHATLAEGIAQWALGAAQREGLGSVALGGGCFMNRILSAALENRLTAAGLNVLLAEQAPPNDGGLALGQAWVALQDDPTAPRPLRSQPSS